jgi:sterol desaturase/sphingolipid hydroxylase (fatty acid hydroxylase superfamily)
MATLSLLTAEATHALQSIAHALHPLLHAMKKLALVALLLQPLQLLFPVRRTKLLYKGVWTDVGWYFVYMLAGDVLLTPILALIGAGVHALLPAGMTAPFSGLPVLASLPIAFFIFELGLYWGHRWSHEIPFLWRFHAIHHSVEHMGFLANGRFHPIDVAGTRALAMVPLFALGLDDLRGPWGGAIAGTVLFVGTLWSYFIHANVRWRLGPLEWLVATPFFHHWHHTRHDHIDRNYATTLPVMDRLFGTLYMPDAWPEEYGTDTPVPESLHGQLLFPLVPTRRGGVAPAVPRSATSA